MSCKVFQNSMYCVIHFNTINNHTHICLHMLRNRSRRIYTKMIVTFAQQTTCDW